MSQFNVALLCGGGSLPVSVAQACLADGLTPLAIVFKGQPQPDFSDLNIRTVECGLGQVGKVLSILKEHDIKALSMAGYLSKPSLFDLRFDVTGLKLMNSLRTKMDDELLRAVCTFFEDEGIHVHAPHELCPHLLASAGLLAGKALSEGQLVDVSLGVQAATALGMLDIGQAAIVKDGVVLGVEGVEGTKALIERCAPLRGKKNAGGILVKMAKPNQSLKIDLPSIGVETVEHLASLGYEGVAVHAGKSLLLDKSTLLDAAKRKKIFVYGVAND